MKLPISKALSCAGLITLLSAQAQALELESVAYAETRYSDNAGSLKNQKRHDIRNSVGVDAQLTEQRQSLDADFSLSMEHERYMRDTSGDRTAITSGLGLLNLNIVEDFLHWESTYTRAQVVEDALEIEAIDVRNYRNTLLTGPKMTMELSDTTEMDAFAHYVNIENSDENVSDTERGSTGLSLLHHYNQVTQLNLSSEFEKILTEDELDPYDRKSLSLGITRALARSSFSLNVGRSSLMPEFGESLDSNFYQASFRHDELFGHIFQLGYSQDVSDTTVGFVDAALEEEDTGILPDNDYVSRKRWTALLSRTIGLHSYALTGARSDSSYELSGQRTVFHLATFRYQRSVIAHLLAGSSVSYSRRNYVTDPTLGLSESMIYTVDSSYQFSERLNAGSFIRLISRQISGIQGSDSKEFQFGMDFRYQLL